MIALSIRHLAAEVPFFLQNQPFDILGWVFQTSSYPLPHAGMTTVLAALAWAARNRHPVPWLVPFANFT